MPTTIKNCSYSPNSASFPLTLLPDDQVKTLGAKGPHDISKTVAKIVGEHFGKKAPVNFKLSLKHREITLITKKEGGVEEEIKLVKDGTDWKQGAAAQPNSDKISKRVERALRKIREASKDSPSTKGADSTASPALKPLAALPLTGDPAGERIEALEKKVATLSASIEKLSEGLKTNLTSNQEAVKSLKKEKANLEKQLADLQEEHRKAAKKIAKQETSLIEAKTRLETLSRRNDKKLESIRKITQELEAGKKAQAAEIERLSAAHTAALHQKTQTIADLERKLAQAKITEEQNARRIALAATEVRGLQAELDRRTTQAQQNSSTDQGRIQELQRELETLRADFQKTQVDKDELSRQLQTAQETHEHMQIANASALQKAETNDNSLTEQLAALEVQHKKMQQQHAAELASAQATLEAAKAETKAATAALNGIQSQKNDFERLYKEAAAKAERLEKFLAQVLEKNKALEAKEAPESTQRIANDEARLKAALGVK